MNEDIHMLLATSYANVNIPLTEIRDWRAIFPIFPLIPTNWKRVRPLNREYPQQLTQSLCPSVYFIQPQKLIKNTLTMFAFLARVLYFSTSPPSWYTWLKSFPNCCSRKKSDLHFHTPPNLGFHCVFWLQTDAKCMSHQVLHNPWTPFCHEKWLHHIWPHQQHQHQMFYSIRVLLVGRSGGEDEPGRKNTN